MLRDEAVFAKGGLFWGGIVGIRENSEKPGTPWTWGLLLPYVALLWLPFYNDSRPSFAGFPFFYWYQFLWVPLTSLLIYIVYRGLK